MFTVFVELQVHPDKVEPFLDGILANSRATLNDEPGCIRFDVQRDASDPTKFYFYEIYLSQQAFEVDHRAASHYAKWREVVAECVVPGTQHNTYAVPQFPGDIPEAPATSGA